jgi:hypothetical protein
VAWIAGALLGASFVLQLSLAIGPLDLLVRRAFWDDAFLYLTVARRWARLGFPTFDGSTPTNGFHPLWQVVLTGLAHLWTDPNMLLRACALACVLANGITGLLLWRIGRIRGGPVAGTLAAGAWAAYLLHPRSLSGMEDPLHGVVFAALVLALVRAGSNAGNPTEEKRSGDNRRSERSNRTRAADVLPAGLLLGANLLCRVDAAALSLFLGVPLGWRLARGRRWASLSALVLPALAAGALSLLLYRRAAGSFFPASGKARLFWALQASPRPVWDVVVSGAKVAARVVIGSWFLVGAMPWAAALPGILAAIAAGGLLVLVLLGRRASGRAHRPEVPAPVAAALPAGLLPSTVFYTLLIALTLQQFARAGWYHQPLRIALCLTVAQLGGLRFARWWGPWPRRGLLALGLVAFLGAGLWSRRTGSAADPGALLARDRLEMARWLSQTGGIPANAPIGSWNAGELGYFAPNRTVVNLDGVVQGPGFLDEVLRTGDWKGYCRRRGIRYLVDYNDEDGAQTYGRSWDRSVWFRGLVPCSQARVLRRFGSVQALDVGEWLEQEGDDGAPATPGRSS